MRTFLVHCPGGDACSFYRAILPVRYAADALLKHGIQLELVTDVLRHERADAILVHRVLHDGAIANLCKMKAHGTRVVWDTDDALDIVPEWNPAKPDEHTLDAYFAGMGCADERWASTGPLAVRVNGKVLPNLIDVASFDEYERPPMRDNRRVQILWCGSTSHRGDLQLIEPALRATLERFAGRVNLTMWGDSPASLLRDYAGRGLVRVDPVPLFSYFRQLCAFQPDIMLAPLAEHPFNRAKSGIKFFEGSMAGAASIVSDCEPYNMVVNRETGMVCRTAEEWADALAELIEDDAFRRKIAANAMQVVRSDWSWDGPKSGTWVDAFVSVLSGSNHGESERLRPIDAAGFARSLSDWRTVQ